MAQDPSASAAAASLPFSYLKHLPLPRYYVVPETCYNTTLIHSTIGLQASASDTKDVTELLPRISLLYCIKNRKVKPAVCYVKGKPTLTVNSHEYYSHECELQDLYSVYEDRDTLCISAWTPGDGGTYAVHADGKTSTFEYQKYKELAEPRETCEVQNCSHESCSCCMISTVAQGEDEVESPTLQVKESSWKELEPRNCVGENLVSNESVTVTTPRLLPIGNTTVPPSTDANSNSWIWIPVVTVVLFLFTFLYRKFKAKGRKRRSSAGSKGSSHGASGDQLMDIEMQAKLSV